MIGIDEKQFIREGFTADIRSDGRACNDSRPLALSLGDLQQCSGSARCTLGSTDVIVGIKVGWKLRLMTLQSSSSRLTFTLYFGLQAELGSPLPNSPDCGGVQITVECSPCAGAVSQVGKSGNSAASVQS